MSSQIRFLHRQSYRLISKSKFESQINTFNKRAQLISRYQSNLVVKRVRAWQISQIDFVSSEILQSFISLARKDKLIDSPEIDSPEIDSPEIDSPEVDSEKEEEDNYLNVERTKFHRWDTKIIFRNRSKSTKVQMSKSNDHLNYIKDTIDKVSINEK